jgi:hypothetical protein
MTPIRKKEEGRRKREWGMGKKEEGRRGKFMQPDFYSSVF